MFSELMTWWLERMRELLPASVPASGYAWRPVLVATIVAADAPVVEMSLRHRRGEQSLGVFEPEGPELPVFLSRLPQARRRSIHFRISGAAVLEREVVLPLAAERDFSRVLSYEMDRLTPFRADEVFWTAAVVRRNLETRQLHLRLTMVPRPCVQPILDVFRRAKIIPSGLDAGERAGRRRVLPLADTSAVGALFGPRAERYAIVLCCILALVAIALPFIRQSLAFADADARIEAVRPLVLTAGKLRERITNGTTTADVISVARKQAGRPIQAIAALTDVLPDDTYVTSVGLRQRSYTISGRSAGAARLIGAMAAHPLIRNPVFTAPVIRDEVNGGEMYSIRAEIGG